MAGAGTTCKMALLNNRHYLGFEVHPPYHMEAMRRLREAHMQYCERLDDWFLRPQPRRPPRASAKLRHHLRRPAVAVRAVSKHRRSKR